jgi:hypothetical protein
VRPFRRPKPGPAIGKLAQKANRQVADQLRNGGKRRNTTCIPLCAGRGLTDRVIWFLSRNSMDKKCNLHGTTSAGGGGETEGMSSR